MSDLEAIAPGAVLQRRIEAVRQLALHRHLGLEIEAVEAGRARIRLPAGPAAANPMGVVHGGVLYALLDVACYLAAAPLMDGSEDAVTHDLHCSVLRPARADHNVVFEGRILRAGRSLIFGESTASAEGHTVARATVTKSRIAVGG